MTTEKIHNLVSHSIPHDHPYTELLQKQRHKCDLRYCTDPCKDYPRYMMKVATKIIRKKRQPHHTKIIERYKEYLSTVSEKGHVYEKLDDLKYEDVLTEIGATENEYLDAISTVAKGPVGSLVHFPEIRPTDTYTTPYIFEFACLVSGSCHAEASDNLAIMNYISKYVTKFDEGVGSKILDSVRKEPLSLHSGEDKTKLSRFKNFIRGLSNFYGAVREVGDTECIYELKSYSIWTHKNFKIRSVDNRDIVDRTHVLKKNTQSLEDSESPFCKSIYDHYRERPKSMDKMSFFEFCGFVNYQKKTIQRVDHEKRYVLKIYPYIDMESNEQLTKWFLPWRIEPTTAADIKPLHKLEYHQTMGDYYSYLPCDFEKLIGDSYNAYAEESEAEPKSEEVDDKSLKSEYNCGSFSEIFSRVQNASLEDTLTFEQLRFLTEVHSKLRSGSQFLIILNGSAGSGKSYFIKVLDEICKFDGIKHIVASTTGNSARLINCPTVHHCFNWSDKTTNHEAVNPRNKSKLKHRFRDTKLMTIEEFSRMSGQE